MIEQPSGRVSLVFTDIEGSTRLLRELGQETYRDALAEHRRILRRAFAAQAGYEVDYEGDSFFYAFPSAQGAVSAVTEAMRGLASGPVRIRVGIHTGEPGLDPPKYVGLDVHVAARVMSVGYGGQVLLSKATRELVDADFSDLGEHRLKDLADPVWIYQLGAGEFPPLKSLNNTNLPAPASSFLGREPELADAAGLLERSRVVTVSGPGGAGKTRFAIELASRQLAAFPNGVFWVPLASLRDPALVTETVAQSIGAKDGLAQHIADRRMLLLLDNLEQVIEASPELSALVSACPNLSLLVTSRELMRVDGEVEFALPPLADPEAVALFCARSRHETSEAIEELCARLDGLPLAIELAAARMSVFTPEQLLARLRERLDLLRGRRDADPRQQTLRATIEWSYDLLDENEKAFFRRLAVFAGGCALDAAERVAGGTPDLLQSLVEKSLVRRTQDRFWMLETIREFGLDELEDEGETDDARERYGLWVESFAQEAGLGLDGSRQTGWFARLRDEYPNVREVIARALEAGDVERALKILVALDRYWWVRPGEAMSWFGRVLERREHVQPALLADALRVAGTTAWFFGQPQTQLSRGQEALAIFERIGDDLGAAKAKNRLTPSLLVEGRNEEAEAMIAEAIATFRRLAHERELRFALHVLGAVRYEAGAVEAAAKLYEESAELSRKAGDLQWVAANLELLSELRINAGELGSAIDLAKEALQIRWENRDLTRVAICFALLASACGAHGAIRTAAILWGASERLDEELGPTQWRTWKPELEALLDPTVLDDAEGLGAGRVLPTAEAVEMALVM